MSWFTELFAAPIDKIVEKTGEAIDKLITSDEERLRLRNELEKIQLEGKLALKKAEDDAEIRLEEEVTKRWEADAESDSKLAKVVRPASLLYLMGFVSILAVTDGNIIAFGHEFIIKGPYIDLFEALLMLAFGAYYGSRGLEKIFNRKKV